MRKGVLDQQAAALAPVLLSEGDFYRSGDEVLAPYVGNYTTAGSALSNGSAGDTTTRVNATGAQLIVVRVLAEALDLSAFAATFKWLGDVTFTLHYWDGSAWQTFDAVSASPGTHGSYSDETISWNPDAGNPEAAIYAIAIESDSFEGSEFMSCSDWRTS